MTPYTVALSDTFVHCSPAPPAMFVTVNVSGFGGNTKVRTVIASENNPRLVVYAAMVIVYVAPGVRSVRVYVVSSVPVPVKAPAPLSWMRYSLMPTPPVDCGASHTRLIEPAAPGVPRTFSGLLAGADGVPVNTAVDLLRPAVLNAVTRR